MWQLAAFGDGGDVRFGLEDFDVGVALDVLGADDARLVDAEIQRLRCSRRASSAESA
jgi:hypothetical protein